MSKMLQDGILKNEASEQPPGLFTSTQSPLTIFTDPSDYFESHGEDNQELIDLSVTQGDSLLADFVLDFEETLQLPVAMTESDDEPEVE
jgi:hypothetical protein